MGAQFPAHSAVDIKADACTLARMSLDLPAIIPRTRAEPELLDALDAIVLREARPGVRFTRSDAVRMLLWEAIVARQSVEPATEAA